MITYKTYVNPVEHKFLDEAYLTLAEYDPRIAAGRVDTDLDPVTYALGKIRDREDLPDIVQEWRDMAYGWLPDEVLSWSINQAMSNGDTMAPMPQEWWLARSEGVVTARTADTGQLIGSVALTNVLTKTDRSLGQQWLKNEVLAYELRALCVDEDYSNLPVKVGTNLVKQAVALGYRLPPASIAAVTTSPWAARIFAKLGASNAPDVGRPDFQLPASVLRYMMCWSQPMTSQQCFNCPNGRQEPNPLWVWPRKPAPPIVEVMKEMASTFSG